MTNLTLTTINPDQALDRIAVLAAGLPNHSTERITSDTLRVVQQRTPGWALLVAILLFPFGLLALAVKEPVVTLITLKGNTITTTGQPSQALRQRLAIVFPTNVRRTK